jgi:heat shock protein HslJ
MSFVARSLPLLLALGLAAALPTQAADAASQPAAQPGPNRRAADPALVRSLQDNVWTLQSGTEASGQPIDGLMLPGQTFALRFDGVRLAVSGGCNQMNGSWRISPQGQLMVGRLAATMKACEPALMKADAVLSALLAQHLDVQLQGGAMPSLRLVSPTRQTLALSGQPTLESQYGAATRIFMEVGPQTVECVSGVMRTQCLRVRERRFDAQGLRIEPPGEWRIFHGGIDGYTHSAGVRNVLRINRYQRNPVPADASAYVYVLDMVVESETVKP